MFHESVSIRQGIVLWTWQGRLDTHAAPPLRHRLQALLSQGHRAFVIDCEQLEHIDTYGLGLLLHLRSEIHQVHGRLVLTGVGAEPAAILDLTGLDRVFEILDRAEMAVRLLALIVSSEPAPAGGAEPDISS